LEKSINLLGSHSRSFAQKKGNRTCEMGTCHARTPEKTVRLIYPEVLGKKLKLGRKRAGDVLTGKGKVRLLPSVPGGTLAGNIEEGTDRMGTRKKGLISV
jgi:hypothetical protein